jgi:Asp-tRNA(Asn)/Glu-tRNA(Gln) amidotransferase A subunit family amidase
MLDRRRFLLTCSAMGFGSTLLPGVLWAIADGKTEITEAMIEQAQAMADVTIPAEYRKMMLESLNEHVQSFAAIFELHMANSVAPALLFDPVLPASKFETEKRPMRVSAPAAVRTRGVPANLEELCFHSARDLGELVRSKKVSSLALTEMYLERLKRYDPQLHFVITLTEDRALAKAKEADREIASGQYRGPLHGLPWGAKDLLAVAGYPTTWGAGGFEQQTFAEDAVVVKRLDAAGAVLLAKLSLGALAMDDRWFGGKTRNPWNPAQGSSGSSAGSASATAAGCLAFAIGSETLGSISSPSTRCGATGLRPTFGLVPRTGAMALSWSMDKLGPICRSVEDTALVLNAIYGPDGKDRTVKSAAFNWDAGMDWKRLRVGYLKEDFEKPFQTEEEPAKPDAQLSPQAQKKRAEQKVRREQSRLHAEYDRQFERAAIAKLEAMGVNLIPVTLPKFPYDAMVPLLDAEAAAAFDELTRSGRDRLLTEQGPDDWPTTFRAARFIPAVEYIQANRARMLAMEALDKTLGGFDVIVAPTNSQQLVVTNLTGHPALILPNGFRRDDAPPAQKNEKGEIEGNYGGPGTPVSLTFLGQLFGEGRLLALAHAYQQATTFHTQHPKLTAVG